MSRYTWDDIYLTKHRRPKRRVSLPHRRIWVWVAVIVFLTLLVIVISGQVPPSGAFFLVLFFYLCRFLSLAIFIRAILSWFPISRYNWGIILLDDVAEPVLAPLRRIIPRVGRLDITPLVAILIFSFLPDIISLIVT